MTAAADLRELFDAAEVDGYLHAVDLRTRVELAYDADLPVVLASVFKIPVLLELFRQHESRRLDVTAPVEVPTEGRSPGPFGMSVMQDPATMSLRDLAWLMIGISDNAATDVICDQVGVTNVNQMLHALGLKQTRLIGACRDIFETIAQDLGKDGLDGLYARDASELDALRAADPRLTTSGTAREITRLLTMIWTDTAGAAGCCEQVRRILGLQVWPHRLASGFPEDGVRISGKTGTLLRWRNEVGVVDYPDGGRYAVAVFSRARRLSEKHPEADAAIGKSARIAVDYLRESSDSTRL